jgi:hypothetical protein
MQLTLFPVLPSDRQGPWRAIWALAQPGLAHWNVPRLPVGGVAAEDAGTPDSHISKLVGVRGDHVQGLAPAHRQAGEGPVVLARDNAVVLLHERNDVLQQLVGEPILERLPRGPDLRSRGGAGGVSGEIGRSRQAAVGHDHEHRPGLLVGQEVVEDETGPAGGTPARIFVTGAVEQVYGFNAFLGTRDGDEVEELAGDFPKRWHVEEFFNAHQALGWNRAGTCNLNIRYGQMTMALVAQAAIDQLRKRLAPPTTNWDAKHMATAYFAALEGDVRVNENTIIVTYYNAPDAEKLREYYEHLPAKLRAEKIDPRVPWLYGFELDFRFR